MNVVEFIREKTENLQQNNAQFIAKLEPKFRNWSDIINLKIANTLNNPWISRFGPDEDDESAEVTSLLKKPEAAALFQRLHSQLGEEIFVGEWHTITQENINQFALVTHDTQWIHTDPERASTESPFKSTVAHGFLTLALIPYLTDTVRLESNPYPEARMIMNHGLNQVRFPYPVKAGSRVRARTRVSKIFPMKRSIEIVSEITIEVEHKSRPACVAETVMRLYF